jgi:hypothetical protein
MDDDVGTDGAQSQNDHGDAAAEPSACDVEPTEALSSYAAMACGLSEDCGCESGCSDGEEGLLALHDYFTQAGYAFDCECLDERRAWVVSLGCEPQSQIPMQEIFGCGVCGFWVGDKTEGEACSGEPGLEGCAQGLACFDGVCASTCAPPVPRGATCPPCWFRHRVPRCIGHLRAVRARRRRVRRRTVRLRPRVHRRRVHCAAPWRCAVRVVRRMRIG